MAEHKETAGAQSVVHDGKGAEHFFPCADGSTWYVPPGLRVMAIQAMGTGGEGGGPAQLTFRAIVKTEDTADANNRTPKLFKEDVDALDHRKRV